MGILLKVKSCVISQEHLLVVILPKHRTWPYCLSGECKGKKGAGLGCEQVGQVSLLAQVVGGTAKHNSAV
jgi:hypothetical protein